MALWKDEPKFEMQVLGRFVWKLVLVLTVTLIAFALIGLVVDAIFDLPGSEVIER